MSKQLHISEDLSLPIDAATQTFAFIARKGAGKTYAAGKLAECLIDAGVQVVVLDSVGNWWGLRLSADGKEAAYDIPVIGGLRGDIPLEATGGKLIADTIVETGRSLIIDVSQFSKANRQRFAYEFGERLWLKKKAERNPSPVHLIIEESQLIIPENTSGKDHGALMVGIYEEIIRLGRNFGIGVSMISQRPQSVNKEVLNQTECLVCLQVNGAHERKALRLWITHQGLETGLVDELPSLPIGTAYVWSPQWLNILKKVRIGQKKTFDASATPKVGSHQVRRDLKPLKLDDLQERMAATIEKAKAEDPKELKRQNAEQAKRIAQLERQLSKAPTDARTNGHENKKQLAEISALRKALAEAVKFIVNINTENFIADAGQPINEAEITAALKGAVAQIERLIDGKLEARNREIEAARKEGQKIIRRLEKLLNEETMEVDVTVKHQQPFAVSAERKTRHRDVSSNGDREPQQIGDLKISKTQQRVLNALAWYESIGIPEPTNTQLGAMALIDSSGGYFGNVVTPLSAAGLIVRASGRTRLTDEGRAIASVPDDIVTLDDYHEQLRKRVRQAKNATNKTVDVLNVIIDAGGEELTSKDIGERVGIDHTGGYFGNVITPLSTVGVIERRSGYVRPTEVLFPPGLS